MSDRTDLKAAISTAVDKYVDSGQVAFLIVDDVMDILRPVLADRDEGWRQVAYLETQLPGVIADAEEARRDPGHRPCPNTAPHTDHTWDAGDTYPWCPGTA